MAVSSTPYPIHVGSYPVYNQMRTEDLILCAEQKGADVIALKVYDLQGNRLAKGRTSLISLRMTDMKEAVLGMDLIHVLSKKFPDIVKIPKPPDGNAPLPDNMKKKVTTLIDEAIDDISERIIRDEVDPPYGTSCPVTTELMHKPVSPNQCGHSYDETTIIGLLERARDKGEIALCPECRTEFDGFKPNVGLARTIDVFVTNQKKKIVPQIHCVEENPEIAAIHIKQAKQHIEDGNYKKAETSFKKALENTKDQGVYHEIPDLYLKMNDPMKAALSFFYSMKYDMNLTTTPINLIGMLLKIHALKVTSTHLEQLLILVYPLTGKKEEASELLAEIGRAWLKEDQPNITIVKQCFQNALKLNPKNLSLYQKLVEIEEDDKKKLPILMRGACHLANDNKPSEAIDIAVKDDLQYRYIDSRFICELLMRENNKVEVMSSFLSKYDGPSLQERMKFAKLDASIFPKRRSDEIVVKLYNNRNLKSKGVQWVARLAKERLRQDDFINAERILLHSNIMFGEESDLLLILNEIYKKHLIDNKQRAEVCHMLGQQYLDKHQYTAAEQHLKEAYTLNPSFSTGIQYAEALALQKKTEECVKQYFDLLGSVIVAADPTTMKTWLGSIQNVDPTLSQLTTDQKHQVYLLKQNQALSETLEDTREKLVKTYEKLELTNLKLNSFQSEQSTTDDEIRSFQIRYYQDRLMSRDEALQRLKEYPKKMLYLPSYYRDNQRFVLEALKVNPSIYRYATPRIREFWHTTLAAVNRDGNNLQYASYDLKDDKEIVLAAVKYDGSCLEHASAKLQNDKQVVMAAVKDNGDALIYASDNLKNDNDIVLTAVKENGELLKYASDKIKNDKEIALAAVKEGDIAFSYISHSLRKDEELTLEALDIMSCHYNCKDIPNNLLSNREFVNKACKLNRNILNVCPREYQEDEEIVGIAVVTFGSPLQYVSPKFQDHRDLVLLAVMKNGVALKYASERLKDDEEVVRVAINQDAEALSYASIRLRDDKIMVLHAVSKKGKLLKAASEKLQDDENVVTTAIKNSDETILKYASERLRNTKKIVLAAVKKDGLSLEYASPRLTNDEKVVLTAIQNEGMAYRYASQELKKNHVVALAALKKDILAMSFASDELFDDKTFLHAAIDFDYHILDLAPDHLTNNHDFMLKAVRKNGSSLRYASLNVKMHADVRLSAVKYQGTTLKYAPKVVKETEMFVIAAINQNPKALKYASMKFRTDQVLILKYAKDHPEILEGAAEVLRYNKDFVRKAFAINFMVLEYASIELRDDKPFVLSLVKKCGLAIDYVSDRLINDIEIIFAAVPYLGSVLKYVPEKFRNDKNVVLAAVEAHSDALQYASEEIRSDKQFIISLLKSGASLEHVSDKIKNDPDVVDAAGQKKSAVKKYLEV